jgi:phosphoribosylamine---glycine ligase
MDLGTVLVVGGWGREAFTAEAFDDIATRVFLSPGNGGTAYFETQPGSGIARATQTPDFPNCNGFVSYLKKEGVELVVTGSESDLVEGLVDIIRGADIPVFGATKKMAELEESKTHARKFTERHGIPGATFQEYESGEFLADRNAAVQAATVHYEDAGTPLVIKADGLCGGKGVTIAHNLVEFIGAVDDLERFKGAGQNFLVEEYLEGVEVSVTILVDGQGNYVMLPAAQDYKPLNDGDTGPMTGSMGSVTIDLPEYIMERITSEVIGPTLTGAETDGNPLTSCAVYFGLMIDEEGTPNLLEYNMRLGDSETQVIGAKTDNFPELLVAAAGDGGVKPEISEMHYATINMVAEGYGTPGGYATSEGHPITGIDVANEIDGVRVIIAATEYNDGEFTVKGSRNLNVMGEGRTPEEAIAKAYEGVAAIESEGLYHRTDIGCNLEQIHNLFTE